MTHITNTKLLERIDTFLTSLANERVALIHDTDPDGVCSAVITATTIKRLRGKPVDLRLPLDKTQYGITPAMISALKKHKITTLITLDFSPDQNLDLLKTLEKKLRILVVDHHKLYNEYQSSNVILYKPQLFSTIEPSQYCTAKLAYDMCIRVCDVLDLDWMAVCGCICDIATTPWLSWIKTVFKKYQIPYSHDLFQTPIGQAGATISSTEIYDVNLVDKAFDVFMRAKNPQDVLRSELGKYKTIIDKELNKHLDLFEKKTNSKKDLFIYELTSPYRIHSVLSTVLGLKYPHRTIIIINTTHSQISVSARRGDKKKAVNELLEQAIMGFDNANAGGHVPAAGAGFPKKHLATFKERLWNTLT